MRFGQGNREVLIKGDPTLTKKVVTPEALKETKIKAVTLVWSLGQTELEERDKGETQLTSCQTTKLEKVLGKYGDIFREPTDLPPRRHLDHKIPIRAEALSVPTPSKI